MRFNLAPYRPLFRALWAICLAAVVWGSLASDKDLQSLAPVLPSNDKLLHFGAYAGLAFLSLLAFTGIRGLVFALLLLPLGALLEFGQHFSPGRTADLLDELANTCGVFTGIALGLLLPALLLRRAQLSPCRAGTRLDPTLTPPPSNS